jgi:hypothetical protein
VSVTLRVAVESAPLERVRTDLLVAPFFAGDRPLRGPAARLDWRLCGLLTDQLVARRIEGRAGEAALLLGGSTLRAALLLAVGLGPRTGFGERALCAAAEDAVARASALRAGEIVLALFAERAWGVAAERAARAVLEGAVAALARRPAALSLRLAVVDAEAGRVRQGLAEAAGAAPPSVAVRLARGEAESAAPAVRPAAAGARPAGRMLRPGPLAPS